MNVAELFVRFTAEGSGDVVREAKRVEASFVGLEGATGRVDAGTKKSHLSMGKLRQELLTLTRQVTGTSPIIAQLGGLLTDFAVGGTVGLVAIAGIAAIAGAYNKMTEGARKAKKEVDDLIDSLIKQKQAAFEATVAGQQGLGAVLLGKELEAQEKLNRARAGSRYYDPATGGMTRTVVDAQAVAAAQAELSRIQSASTQNGLNIADAMDKATEKTGKVAKVTGNAAAEMKRLADEASRLANAMLLASNTTGWMDDFAPRIAGAITQRGQELDAAKQQTGLGVAPEIDMSEFKKPLEGITPPITSMGQKVSAAIKENGVTIATMLTQVASAFLVGGGGKGSQAGSALGGLAGGLLTSKMSLWGSSLGPVGALAGGVIGSLFGGLFDKKAKPATTALNNLAQAAEKVTQSLINLPQGLNVTAYRNKYATPTAPGGPDGPVGGQGGGAFAPTGAGFPMIYVANVNANSSSDLVAEAKREARRGGVSSLRFAIVGNS